MVSERNVNRTRRVRGVLGIVGIVAAIVAAVNLVYRTAGRQPLYGPDSIG